MPSKITLKVTKGKLTGQEFVFAERNTCVIGRAEDCSPKLPSDDDHKFISRHHCLLDINPPDIRVRDFGSLNGTFVNKKKIGQRESGMTLEEAAKVKFPEHDLKDGDEIELGTTIFKVGVRVPAHCADCAVEIPEAKQAQAKCGPNVYRCDACRVKAEKAKIKVAPKAPVKKCAKCGKDVSKEVGQNRQGQYVCATCRADPMEILKLLLGMAKSGNKELVAIQGYAIERELGRGGFGAVYLARHERSGEQIALKVMLPKVAAEKHNREFFLREAENTKALVHRNVVRLRDAGCSQGTFFLTTELCEGGSVDKLMLSRGGKLPFDEAVRIIFEVLDGLEYAHNAPIPYVKSKDGGFGSGRGVVHRDMKPQNIFLSSTGTSRVAKVGDYGLAKAFDTAGLSGLTRTGTVGGTPFFMSRQQVINFKYSKPDVDVWSTAACLYNMITGAVPRDFHAHKDMWHVLLNTDAVPIRRRDPSVPRKLAEVIDTALVDRPDIRFKSAAEFKRAMQGAL